MKEHRSELNRRIEERRLALQQAFDAAERAGHPAARIDALRTELSVVDNATQGGWDTIDEGTAEMLSRWLDTTAVLVPATRKVRKSPAMTRENHKTTREHHK